MDAVKPFGDEAAPTPKNLVLASLCGCTGMDVIGLLKKNKQTPHKLSIEAEADINEHHPHELKDIRLKFFLEGDCRPDTVAEAVNLSQTKYCSISSMLSKGTSIRYDVSVNGKPAGSGRSDFASETK